uniref:DNA-3-methyladenine glycosylase family protein n=1 Tax=uncultured Rhizobium sp. TaxID=155567 RepID=UPI0026193A1D|nr:DNA-3-methyladenine glycosylase 2 family protein [uncultured Rhizobium sp.]
MKPAADQQGVQHGKEDGRLSVIIRNGADLAFGLEALVAAHPGLRPIAEGCGELPLRLSDADFSGLASIIVSQVVSRASADAIWRRMTIALGARPTAAGYLALDAADIAAFGLSRAKAETLRTVANAETEGGLVLAEIAALPAPEAVRTLTALKGVGPWTAEVYLMFCGGHADIFPAGDVALRIAVGDVLFGGRRPEIAEVKAVAEAWSPWRSVAARLFWAHYAGITGRVAVPR